MKKSTTGAIKATSAKTGQSILQRKCACSNHTMAGDECTRCGKNRGALQRANRDSEIETRNLGGVPPIVYDVLSSPAHSLDPETKADAERRMGHDFSRVRVHSDSHAAKSAHAVNALAYTVGEHLVFGVGQHSPGTASGRELIMHELAHVIQQRRGSAPANPDATIRIDNTGELEADQMAQQAGAKVAPTVSTPGGVLQRKGPGKTGTGCSMSICWFPIKTANLGKAGFVHGAINVTDSHGDRRHVEVDPSQHTLPGGLHSHVVNQAGHKTGKDCQSLTASCAEVTGVLAAAKSYEAKDVTYDATSGPNSNSFLEWTLTDAGVGTGAVKVPMGAWGWNFYTKNSAMRTSPPAAPRATKSTSACPKTFAKATNFRDLVDMVREAEVKMKAASITDIKDQIKTLRGIYYGTTWSMDFLKEKSLGRNVGFQAFTQSVSAPKNPAATFDCGLFDALMKSAEVTERGRHVDFGHLITALDARSGPLPSAPFLGFGGTGTEIVTWLGDLGGGAGSLAKDRATTPSTSVSHKFKGSDYGGSVNLEGDVAGYVVARGGKTDVDAPEIPAGKGIADVVEDYLSPGKPSGSEWMSRARTFLLMLGGKVDKAGNLTNKPSMINGTAKKIETFACQYLVRRAGDGKITEAQLVGSTDHVIPASEEVSQTFFDAIEDSAKTGGKIEATKFPASKPAVKGACSTVMGARAAGKSVGKVVEDIEKRAGEIGEKVGKRAGEITKEAKDAWKKWKPW